MINLYNLFFRDIKLGFLTILILFLTSSCLLAEKLPDYLKERVIPLRDVSHLDDLIHSAGDKKLVLLGESTHGTSEYYTWRAEISKRLIKEKQFSFIAVEGDWATIYRLNAYVKGLPESGNSAREIMRSFNRWPVWMWANTETEELVEWLRDYNKDLPENQKIGFYGMDVYGQWDALFDLLEYAENNLPDLYPLLKPRLECFLQYGTDEWQYARAVRAGRSSCEDVLIEVVNLLADLDVTVKENDPKGFFRAKQNALVVKNAEDFFRLAVQGGADSWNSRVSHMNKTVNRLLGYYGPETKGIVWAHNTHIGDSYATSMQQQGMYNIGHLSRRDHGRENVFLIGFTTYTGKVMAGQEWGSRQVIMDIPPGISGSVENIFNGLNHKAFYIIFNENDRLQPRLTSPLPHRAIGVVYNPRNERGNYVPTILTERYDAFIFFRETKAVTPVK